ncbi:MAG: DUF5063 domain-containing protein [Phycisphaerae bacterium]|nr:DUF5063 domain-containing protein [Gemmatimonadaceae bacterium]
MNVLQTPAATNFRTAVRAYCAHVESRQSISPAVWLPRVHVLLVELYAAGLQLPSIEPGSENANPEYESQGDWQRLFDDFGQAFGRWNAYRLVFDPYDTEETEALYGSLADDFAEIFGDVRRGELHENERGDAFPNDVMWEWRFAFESHWSRHATSALNALGSLQFQQYATAMPESFGTWTGASAT